MKPVSGQPARSPYASSGAAMGIICGVIAAFFISPWLYGLTIPHVYNTAYRFYHPDFYRAIEYGTWAVWAGVVFFLVRALVFALFMMAGYAMSRR